MKVMNNIKAVLFDLDDTLLGNNMDEFLPHYFSLVTEYVRPFIGPEKFMQELLFCTQAMIQDDDRSTTNREVFWSIFCDRTGLEQDVIEPYINGFYLERFPELESVTTPRPIARNIVEHCLNHSIKVVIATNPLFPLKAIEHRLCWAGFPMNEFDFELITAYENMHSAKPNLAYYEEILEVVAVEPNEALMVGDDWENDMVPAKKLGLHTYWISDTIDDELHKISIDDYGSLEILHQRFLAGWLIAQ